MYDTQNIENQIQSTRIGKTIVEGPAINLLLSFIFKSNKNINEHDVKELIQNTYNLYYMRYPIYFNKEKGSQLSFLKLCYNMAKYQHYKQKQREVIKSFHITDNNNNNLVYDKHDESDIISYITNMILQIYTKTRHCKHIIDIIIDSLINNIDNKTIQTKYNLSRQRIENIINTAKTHLKLKINRDGTPRAITDVILSASASSDSVIKTFIQNHPEYTVKNIQHKFQIPFGRAKKYYSECKAMTKNYKIKDIGDTQFEHQ